MQISVSFGLEDLAHLPLDLRQRIHQALALPVVAVTTSQPAQATVQFTQPAVQQAPPAQPAPAPYAPPVTKAPLIQGNTKVWMPDMGHQTQVSSAVDVMTGQTVPVAQLPAAPVIPQYSNAPVAVTAVPMGSPAPVGPHPQADYAATLAAAVKLYQNKAIGGEDLLKAAVERSGIGSMPNLNQSNAGALYAAIQAVGGL